MGFKFTFRSFENFLDLLRDNWDDDNYQDHFTHSTILQAQLMSMPGILAFHYLPILTKFVERNGPYGVDGIFFSAISSCNNLNIRSPEINEAFRVAKSIKRRQDFRFKDNFMIHFVDYIGFSLRFNEKNSSNFNIKLPESIRGIRNRDKMFILDNLGRPVRNENYNFALGNVYEHSTTGGTTTLFESEKRNSTRISLFPDVNRDELFNSFGKTLSDRPDRLTQFSQTLRNAGNRHYDRPHLAERNRSWYMHDPRYGEDNQNDVGYGVYVASVAVLGVAVAEPVAADVMGSGGTKAGVYGALAKTAVERNTYENLVRGTEKGIGFIHKFFTSFGKEEEPDVPQTGGESTGANEAGKVDIKPTNDSDKKEIDVGLTDGTGNDPNPEKGKIYPKPEGSGPVTTLPDEIIGEMIDKIINGTHSNDIIYPNPDAIDNRGNIVITNLHISKFDPYIYPNENAVAVESKTLTDLLELLLKEREQLINPSGVNDDYVLP